MEIIKFIKDDLKKDKLVRNLQELKPTSSKTRMKIGISCLAMSAFCMLLFIFLIVVGVVL